MQSREPQCAVRACPGVLNERRQEQVAAAPELLQQDKVFQGKGARALSTRGAAVWGRPLVGRNGGVGSVHTLAPDLVFRVCGVPGRPICLCGGAAAYGSPGTALRGLFWVFILVRPSVGFSRSLLHGG